MADAIDDNEIDDEETDKEYRSFFQEYNARELPSKPALWEYGDKKGEFQYNDNPTWGYWEEYYDDLESGWINEYLIDEIRIFEKHISYQIVMEAENNFLRLIMELEIFRI